MRDSRHVCTRLSCIKNVNTGPVLIANSVGGPVLCHILTPRRRTWELGCELMRSQHFRLLGWWRWSSSRPSVSLREDRSHSDENALLELFDLRWGRRSCTIVSTSTRIHCCGVNLTDSVDHVWRQRIAKLAFFAIEDVIKEIPRDGFILPVAGPPSPPLDQLQRPSSSL